MHLQDDNRDPLLLGRNPRPGAAKGYEIPPVLTNHALLSPVAPYGYFDWFFVVGVVSLARTYESPNSGLRPLGPALTIAVGGSL